METRRKNGKRPMMRRPLPVLTLVVTGTVIAMAWREFPALKRYIRMERM